MERKPRRVREEKEFEERVVVINRVSKTVKGGRRMRFSALVVVGDRKGRVGYGLGKANEVPDAIKKAVGVIAGGAVRAVLELAGITDVLSKCIGSRRPINVVHATVAALQDLKTVESVAKLREKKTTEIR